MIGRILWDEFFSNRDWPVASAVAILLLLLLVPFMMWYQSIQRAARSPFGGFRTSRCPTRARAEASRSRDRGLKTKMTLALMAVIFPDTVMLSACVVLTLAVVIFVFWIEPDPGDSAPHRSQLDQLLERRDSIYDNLRDLKFENRAGKYAEQDYEQMRDSLENEAAQVLLEIERVTGNQAPIPRRDPATAANFRQ
jgi:type II secretory pathway component PulM